MSPKMAAIVATIVGEQWTEPTIGYISITSDGFLVSGSNFLGSVDDLERNTKNLLDAAELTDEERTEFWKLYHSKIQDWRVGGNAYAG